MLHLDLDAFFASVEQRDKPSLRGRPVVVGGVGSRGVVATASYEARVYGVRSAMPAGEARRRCPHAAFLAGRFGAYREASGQVMGILRALSPLVEPISLDEAFVDLRAAPGLASFDAVTLQEVVDRLRADVAAATGGLPASVGVASSKFMAKVATELAKPDGSRLVPPGTELDVLRPMTVGVIPGVGPVTQDKLRRIGVRTVADLQAADLDELVPIVGRAAAEAMTALALARDDRPVVAEREAKSISTEDTFETDLTDRGELAAIVARDARQVAARLGAAGLFARTVSLKVRRHDFATLSRSRTLLSATDRPEVIASVARSLLDGVDVTDGVRLLGVGVAGLTDVLQEDLFSTDHFSADRFSADHDAAEADPAGTTEATEATVDGADGMDRGSESGSDEPPVATRRRPGYLPGFDVTHTAYGPGWVWGTGLGRVTVRFETRDTPPGPVRTFREDDPDLTLV